MASIQIDNRDTQNVHIDTYSSLTGDSFEEYEIESLREQHGDSELTYDDFEWSYDHAGIVKDLANASINILTQAIAYTEYADVIKSITFVSSGSPKYYNYTTDHYVMSVDVDDEKLQAYIDANKKEITERAQAYDDTTINGTVSPESMNHAGVCHILDNCIVDDYYNSDMYELEHEIYSNNVTIEKITK